MEALGSLHNNRKAHLYTEQRERQPILLGFSDYKGQKAWNTNKTSESKKK